MLARYVLPPAVGPCARTSCSPGTPPRASPGADGERGAGGRGGTRLHHEGERLAPTVVRVGIEGSRDVPDGVNAEAALEGSRRGDGRTQSVDVSSGTRLQRPGRPAKPWRAAVTWAATSRVGVRTSARGQTSFVRPPRRCRSGRPKAVVLPVASTPRMSRPSSSAGMEAILAGGWLEVPLAGEVAGEGIAKVERGGAAVEEGEAEAFTGIRGSSVGGAACRRRPCGGGNLQPIRVSPATAVRWMAHWGACTGVIGAVRDALRPSRPYDR